MRCGSEINPGYIEVLAVNVTLSLTSQLMPSNLNLDRFYIWKITLLFWYNTGIAYNAVIAHNKNQA